MRCDIVIEGKMIFDFRVISISKLISDCKMIKKTERKYSFFSK